MAILDMVKHAKKEATRLKYIKRKHNKRQITKVGTSRSQVGCNKASQLIISNHLLIPIMSCMAEHALNSRASF